MRYISQTESSIMSLSTLWFWTFEIWLTCEINQKYSKPKIINRFHIWEVPLVPPIWRRGHYWLERFLSQVSYVDHGSPFKNSGASQSRIPISCLFTRLREMMKNEQVSFFQIFENSKIMYHHMQYASFEVDALLWWRKFGSH